MSRSARAGIPPAPVARQAPVVDDYFGTRIVDPYRWMETPNSPELAAYLKAQNERTRAILDSIPGRAPLLARIRSLEETVNSTSHVERHHGWVFFEKLTPGSNISRLFVRRGMTGPERVLVDPLQLSQGGQHEALSYWSPSNDGAYVAVGLARGGSENAVIHIFETATGRQLPERLERAQYGVASWRPDNLALYYIQLQPLRPGSPAVEKFRNAKTFLHVLGADPRRDVPVFGIGVSPGASIAPDDDAVVFVDPTCPYAIGTLFHGVRNEVTLYSAPRSELDGGHAHWTKLVDVDDAVTRFAFHGHDLYLLTHKGAPRYKLVRLDLRHPDIGAAPVVIAPSARVLEGVDEAEDALYVESLEDGLGRITRVDWNGNRSEIPLPVNGTVSGLDTEFDERGFVARLESWTVSPLWYQYDPASGRLADTRLDPPSPVDYSGVVSDEVKVPASDGVLVPLSIIHLRSMKRDGSNPTLLYAYGAYGLNSNPSFGAVRLAWFERGGIYAIAHVRGGGEYGEEWHQAGRGVNKEKTISDFIDCARWLIARGYTSPARLGGRGGSAGGITMGGAITQAPELFAAIDDEIPVSDQLRIEFTANGPPNIPEFGSVRTKEGFKILYATSPVQHVRPGGRYPAVILCTGANDPRVEPWQAAKMAATLQADSASGRPILLRVDYEGGHGLIGAMKSQATELAADTYTFLLWNMGVPGFQPTL